VTEANLINEFRASKFLIVPGHYDFFGGAERQATILAESLVNEYGCHVDFLGWGGDGIFAEEVRAIGCKPWIFPLDQRRRGIRMALDLFRLSRMIRREIQPHYLLPFVGFHCKVIGKVWKHTGARFTWWNQRDEGRLISGTRTEHQLMRSLPAIVSNSFEGRDFLVDKFGLAPGRVRVINNGVRIPPQRDGAIWRHRLGLASEDLLVVMVANLTSYKDHTTLLKAFASVRRSDVGLRSRLLFAGRHGETTLALKALAFDLGLCDCVHMPGQVEDIDLLLSAADLVVHSSITEGCPNGVLEAMAHGRPVAGTNISGMRQALGDAAIGKFLAVPGDSDDLAKIMIRLLNCPSERSEAGKQNLDRIKSEFSISQMTRNVLDTVLQCRR
jgi:glycosyltransferase involved in cell wall biosynthesis